MYVPRAHLRKGSLKSDPTVILIIVYIFSWIHTHLIIVFLSLKNMSCSALQPCRWVVSRCRNKTRILVEWRCPIQWWQARPHPLRWLLACTQVNTYLPTHRYSAPRSTLTYPPTGTVHPGRHLPTHPQVQCTQVDTYLPTHRYSAPRSTLTYPPTGTVHPGQHLPTHPQVQCTQVNTYLPTHRYSAPRSTLTYPPTGTVHPGPMHPGQHLPTHSQAAFFFFFFRTQCIRPDVRTRLSWPRMVD